MAASIGKAVVHTLFLNLFFVFDISRSPPSQHIRVPGRREEQNEEMDLAGTRDTTNVTSLLPTKWRGIAASLPMGLRAAFDNETVPYIDFRV